MNAYKVVIALLLFLPLVNAQYWFQSGAQGGQATQFNSGAQVAIQTVSDQQPTSGSIAFWVGEDLANGAFLQTGYVIENQSGRYPSYCDINGCNQYEYISAGSPEWFYEYFPPNSESSFFGGIGPNDSAGINGSFHTYGFYANGTVWYFTMNGNVIGKVNLDANTSGYNDVVAFGEVANTSNAGTNISDVKFYNLSIYRFGKFVPAPTGYSYIGYGVGSLNNLLNPYGVQEIDSRSDAFEVGSGIQEQRNNYPLWTNSYSLDVVSQYGNLSGTEDYLASKTVGISAPLYVYMGTGTRAMFMGWSGSGAGSYTGSPNSTAVLMYSNITEVARWQLQYLVNVSSAYSVAHGSGWYPANSTAYYSLEQNTTYLNASSRYVFGGWTNTNNSNSLKESAKISGPTNIGAIWNKEYLVNASAQYGNTTGSGWYPANSVAMVSVLSEYENESSTERLAFYSWSDGNTSVMHSVVVNKPYNLYASFRNQFLITLYGEDEYGSEVNVQTFYLTNSSPGNQLYLFGHKGYMVTHALYKGSNVTVNQQIFANSSGSIAVHVPLYDIEVSATDVFGNPVQVPVTLTLANGTIRTVMINNGSSVVTVVEDAPYGRAIASTKYLGLQLSSSVQYGENVKFTVISLEDLEIFAGIIVLAFAIYFLSSRYVLRHPNPSAKQIRKGGNQ